QRLKPCAGDFGSVLAVRYVQPKNVRLGAKAQVLDDRHVDGLFGTATMFAKKNHDSSLTPTAQKSYPDVLTLLWIWSSPTRARLTGRAALLGGVWVVRGSPLSRRDYRGGARRCAGRLSG